MSAKDDPRIDIPPPDSCMFGQFLVEVRKINADMRDKALEIQREESSSTLRNSHRLLGQILQEEFNVFSSRVELHKYLEEFHDYKKTIDKMRFEARIASSKKY